MKFQQAVCMLACIEIHVCTYILIIVGDDGHVDTPSSSHDADLLHTEEEDQPPATKRRRSSRRHSRKRSLVVAPMSTDSESGTNTSTEGSQEEELKNGMFALVGSLLYRSFMQFVCR